MQRRAVSGLFVTEESMLKYATRVGLSQYEFSKADTGILVLKLLIMPTDNADSTDSQHY